MNYWLMKTEPEEFSWDDLVKKGAKGEAWTGVRNFIARGHLKDRRKAISSSSITPARRSRSSASAR